MKIIGLTGGIGSGKTTVAKIFEMFDIPIFVADEVGRLLSDNDKTVVAKIKSLFSETIYTQQGLDRKQVAKIVFSNKEMLQKLNDIIHPAVKQRFDDFKKLNCTKKFVLMESAILIDSGFYKICDFSVLVSVPLDVRIKRASKRDGVDETVIKQRVANQMSENLQKQYCKYVINNYNALVISQIEKILSLES